MKKSGYIVSACLLGRRCRYNGEDKAHPGVMRFLRGKRFLALCPEMLAGWGAPRLPVEFHGGGAARVALGKATIRDSRGRDRTESLMRGIRKALTQARRFGASAAILKEKSPSCGVHRVYRDRRLVRGPGLFAHGLRQKGVRVRCEQVFPAGKSTTS
jgi:uncharacterized protein YbbK (DUF523 family)